MMIAQTLSFSKKGTSTNSSILIDQFLKEAFQILRHADTFLSDQEQEDQQEGEDSDIDNNKEAVTWHLNLTASSMTLNTSINTISGLEKVLELIRINVKPQPPKFKDYSRKHKNADHSLFRHMVEPVLKLSTIPPSSSHQILQQCNTASLMRHYIQAFIDCGYAFFLDTRSLIANTEMILSQPNAAAKEHKVETLLVTSICCLMAKHTAVHHRDDSIMASSMANTMIHTFYNQARQLLQDVFDVHHIAVVQSLFILSCFPQGHTHLFSPARTKNSLLTMAIRMALAMDLHKPESEEKLRRLAWMIFCADYYADFNTTGQTGLIDIADWHVDFPQALPNEPSSRSIEFFSHYCRVVLIRKLDLLKSAYTISLQSQRALESGLDEKLFQTYFNTPATFKLDLDQPKSDIESLLLYELYCHTQLFAQLPFLPRRYVEQFIVQEETSRNADLNDIHQRLGIPFTPSLLPEHHQHQDTIIDKNLELHCLVRFLATLDQYTQILEIMATLDTTSCHHNPVYGTILSIHLYLMIEKSCGHAQIRAVCQTNLVRTQRLLQRGESSFYFLDRMLSRGPKTTQICSTREIIRSLLIATSYIK